MSENTGEPRIAAKTPALLELSPGTYYWCRCGHSKNQPFCDGSHEGKGFEPLEFEVSETKNYAFCQCKHTRNGPFCDGSHRGV